MTITAGPEPAGAVVGPDARYAVGRAAGARNGIRCPVPSNPLHRFPLDLSCPSGSSAPQAAAGPAPETRRGNGGGPGGRARWRSAVRPRGRIAWGGPL